MANGQTPPPGPKQPLLAAEPLDRNFGVISSERTKGHSAYLRVIYLVPASYGTLRMKTHLPQGSPIIEKPISASMASMYNGAPIGAYTFELNDGANPAKTLARASATFAVNAYATLWVRVKSGRLAIDIVDDNYVRETASNRLSVLNAFPGAAVSVTSIREEAAGAPTEKDIVPGVRSQRLTTDQFEVFDHLPANHATLWNRVELPAEKYQTFSEVDFKAAKRWTLVFLPDEAGRLNGQLLPDGPLVEAEKITEQAGIDDSNPR